MDIGLRIPLRFTPMGPSGELLKTLVGFWEEEELTGQRDDSHTNALHLTDNNSVGRQSPAVVGDGASFTRLDNHYLSHVYDARLGFDDEAFTVLCWVNLDTLGPAQVFVDFGLNSGQARRHYYSLSIRPTRRASFSVSHGGVGEQTRVEATTFGALSTGIWYLLAGFHDPVEDTVGVSVNAGTIDTAPHAFGSLSDVSATFALGRRGGFRGGHMNADQDQVAIFRKLLSPMDVDAFFNLGFGRSYLSLI